jgi:hypothetical protein
VREVSFLCNGKDKNHRNKDWPENVERYREGDEM